MDANTDPIPETYGVYEAKTKLSELIERVSAGEEVVITRHGRPVARLVPPAPSKADLGRVATTLQELRDLGREAGFALTQDEIKAAVNEGRR